MRRVTPALLRRKAWRTAGLRGVAFLYFSLLALPAFFVGAGMATDFTRIIIAHRQVSDTAQAAAVSGAQEFDQDSPYLNKTSAEYQATRTFCIAQRDNVMSMATGATPTIPCVNGLPGTAAIKVTLGPTGADSLHDEKGEQLFTQVSVTAHYRVEGLIFTNFFGLGSSSAVSQVTKTAQVCLPGVASGPTGGYCQHLNR